MSSETDLQTVLPAWLDLTSQTDVSLGLDPSEAFQRAERLLNDLRSGQASTEGWAPEPDQVEVLHALVALVCREAADPKAALRDIELVFDFISALPWPVEDLVGPRELLATCAFQAWRTARRFATHPEVQKWVSRVRTTGDAQARAERALMAPIAERQDRVDEMRPDDPEFLLCICESLWPRIESAPASVREDAEFFYKVIEKPTGIGIHDEHQYFLGELALAAGTASRFLFRIEDAKTWFQLAETSFALVQNANAHRARVAYQRMALSVEERRFEDVLVVAPSLAATLCGLDMPEAAIKCRFLEAAVHWELEEAAEAINISEGICRDAESLGSPRLVALAATNLFLYYTASGEVDRAIALAQKALPVLHQLDDRVHMVRLRWNLGELLRKKGKRTAALEAFREAQAEAQELGMRGDSACFHLVVADVLLEAGQEAQAELEIRAALPIIDEEKMVPEGIAALSLLRESLRRRQIDHGALRNLHRHLEDPPL